MAERAAETNPPGTTVAAASAAETMLDVLRKLRRERGRVEVFIWGRVNRRCAWGG
jgi:hypothetical protein